MFFKSEIKSTTRRINIDIETLLKKSKSENILLATTKDMLERKNKWQELY